MERLGYGFFEGKNGAEGFVKRMGESAAVHCGGLRPGEHYALKRLPDGDTLAEGTADGSGCLSFSTAYPGGLFLSHGAQVILWEGEAEGYWRACGSLREKCAPEDDPQSAAPAADLREETADAPAEKAEAPDIKTETPDLKGIAPDAASHGVQPRLRAAGDGAPVDALPRLRWPQGTEELRPLLASCPPIRMFDEPGWRFVRAPSPIREAAYCAVGRFAEGDAVTQVAYAVPGSPLHPPVPLPGYRWRMSGGGMGYWVFFRDLTREGSDANSHLRD